MTSYLNILKSINLSFSFTSITSIFTLSPMLMLLLVFVPIAL